MLDYLASDAKSDAILLYVEGIKDARAFTSGLRLAARAKPVIVLKAGRHEHGSKAASTHTGALVGSDEVFDAALERAGVVRAMTFGQLFAAAEMLSDREARRRQPAGDRDERRRRRRARHRPGGGSRHRARRARAEDGRRARQAAAALLVARATR